MAKLVKKKLVTKKKEAWVKKYRPNVTLKGTPLNYNAALQKKYEAKLLRLVRKMTDETEKAIARFYKQSDAKTFFAEDANIGSQARILTNALTSRFDSLFAKTAKPTAEQMAKEADKASSASLHTSLKDLSGGLSLKTTQLKGPLKDVMTAVVAENVGLIKSIPTQYLTQVQGAVMRSISTGNGLQDLVPFLEKQKGITQRRARNIALDQTRKAYNGINKGRMLAIGVTKYEWLHTYGGQHPRQLHLELSGKICSLTDPPVIQYDPEVRGIPGQLINCKCRMRPIVEFNEGEEQQ